jgi:phenylacetate-CoA ligase
MDADRGAHISAYICRDRRWWGVDQSEKEVVFWGNSIMLNTQSLVKKTRDVLINSRILSFFDVTEENLFKYLVFLRRYKPRFMYGYASAFYLFSLFLKKQRIDIGNLGIKAVFTTAEKLDEYQRKVIEDAFKCPVAVEYGSREGGFIAQECPHKRMHINAEGIYVEIDRNKGLDNQGEIIVTNLDTFAFPFIRYKTGDIGKLSNKSCPCGRGLPIIESIDGRKTDFLVNKDGRIIHALGLIYVIREIEGVSKFKVHQKDTQSLHVNLVVNHSFDTQKNTNIIRSEIEKLFGHSLSIDINIVDNIPLSRSGKYSYVTSDVVVEYLSDRGVITSV